MTILYNAAHAFCMLDNKAASTHSEYVILMLRYAYIACLVYISMFEGDWLIYRVFHDLWTLLQEVIS